MMHYDNLMTERGVKAYLRRAANSGGSPMHPSAGSSERKGNIVILRNCNGKLARYKVRKNKEGAEYIRFIE